MSKKDKKKEEVVYIDDGSTIADMSDVSGKKKSHKADHNTFNGGIRPRATFKEQWKTYTDAVKMMFLPMLAVLGIIALAYFLVFLLL